MHVMRMMHAMHVMHDFMFVCIYVCVCSCIVFLHAFMYFCMCVLHKCMCIYVVTTCLTTPRIYNTKDAITGFVFFAKYPGRKCDLLIYDRRT